MRHTVPSEKVHKIITLGIKIARQIVQVEHLRSTGSCEHALVRDIKIDDDDSILNWVRNTAVTIYHPTGTCSMVTEKDSVFDNRLKVHLIKNLQVVDASIIPKTRSGNTNASTIMIAEKASDMILKDIK